jgi:hypothetical protein
MWQLKFSPICSITESADAVVYYGGLRQGINATSPCFFCPPGSFYSTSSRKCTVCPAGTFSSLPGFVGGCSLCPAGFYSTQVGATSESTCLVWNFLLFSFLCFVVLLFR